MTTPEASANDAPVDEQGERLRRDEPTRTAPRRQGASMFLPSAGETVDAGVNTAYKVFGDYLRRGQEAAQKQHERGDGPQNPWATPGVPWASMAAVPLQMFRAWASLASTWAELSMVPGASEGVRQMTKLVEDLWSAAGVTPPAATEDPSDARKPTASAAIRCAVELASTQPVEVDIDFDPPLGVVPMIQRLHPLRGEAPPLAGLEFAYDPTTGAAKLALAVPPSQPAGRYVGTIFDDRDDRACGTIKVRVNQ